MVFTTHDELAQLQQQTAFMERYICEFLLHHTPDVHPRLWYALRAYSESVARLAELCVVVDALFLEGESEVEGVPRFELYNYIFYIGVVVVLLMTVV